jgi:hypothetical protein
MGGAVAFADTRPRHPHKIPVAPVARRVVVDPPGHSFVPEGPPTLGAIHRRRLALSTWRAWSFPPALAGHRPPAAWLAVPAGRLAGPCRASRPPPGWRRVSFHWGRWRAAGGLHMTPPHSRQLAGCRHLRIFHAAPIRSARAAGRADRREPGERIGEDQRTDRRAAGPRRIGEDRPGRSAARSARTGELALRHNMTIRSAGRADRPPASRRPGASSGAQTGA